VWRVACGVWRVACGVWRVACSGCVRERSACGSGPRARRGRVRECAHALVQIDNDAFITRKDRFKCRGVHHTGGFDVDRRLVHRDCIARRVAVPSVFVRDDARVSKFDEAALNMVNRKRLSCHGAFIHAPRQEHIVFRLTTYRITRRVHFWSSNHRHVSTLSSRHEHATAATTSVATAKRGQPSRRNRLRCQRTSNKSFRRFDK